MNYLWATLVVVAVFAIGIRVGRAQHRARVRSIVRGVAIDMKQHRVVAGDDPYLQAVTETLDLVRTELER